MRYVPAFGFAAWLSQAVRCFVIGMDLNGQFLLREEEFEQQRKAIVIAWRVTDERPLEFRSQLAQKSSGKTSVCYDAIVAGEPGLADLVGESFCINGRKTNHNKKIQYR